MWDEGGREANDSAVQHAQGEGEEQNVSRMQVVQVCVTFMFCRNHYCIAPSKPLPNQPVYLQMFRPFSSSSSKHARSSSIFSLWCITDTKVGLDAQIAAGCVTRIRRHSHNRHHLPIQGRYFGRQHRALCAQQQLRLVPVQGHMIVLFSAWLRTCEGARSSLKELLARMLTYADVC